MDVAAFVQWREGYEAHDWRTTMPRSLLGLHHVTAICSDPQRNVDFYTRVLGLRLVKQTVNYDDPTTWHLYYGDTLGHPGTVLTFFAWPDAPGGQVGLGQFAAVALAIPAGAFGYWIERLIGQGIAYQQPVRRFGERVVAFRDPDGLNLELVALADPPPSTPWPDSPVPEDKAIRGLHGVSLWQGHSATADFFTGHLAFRAASGEATTERLVSGTGAERAVLDLVGATGMWDGTVAVGTIHHVAWAVADEAALVAWQTHLRSAGLDVTDVRDRTYFKSIYTEAPGGATVELATMDPGFTQDEPAEALGTSLRLPPHLERQRLGLEGMLPALTVAAGHLFRGQ